MATKVDPYNGHITVMCVQCGSYLIHCLGGFRIIKSICFCHLSVSANLDVMFLGCLSTVFVLPAISCYHDIS